MTVLILGATGATGRLLARELLDRGMEVRAIVRSPDRLPNSLRSHEKLSVVHGNVLDMNADTLSHHLAGCDAVASCLGHTMSLKGLFGPPWSLVRDSIRHVCEAVRLTGPAKPIRLVLMNTAGKRNPDAGETISTGERMIIGLLRLLIPPHRDNERAADYLREAAGEGDDAIEWVAVRPDSLVDDTSVTPYELHSSPTRSAIFDPGKTSRINVAHFMASLCSEEKLWHQWRGQMPVIYNQP